MDDNLIAVDTSNAPESFVPMESALGRAIQLWSQGRPIPLPLFVELFELGYDVPALEHSHRKSVWTGR